MHEPADALDQVSRLEPFLDQHGLHPGIQPRAVFGVEIKRRLLLLEGVSVSPTVANPSAPFDRLR